MIKPWLTIGLLAALINPLAIAEGSNSLERGKHYKIVKEHASSSSKIIEFFSYACMHCRILDPSVIKLTSNPESKLSFIRLPVSFGNRQWAGYAKAFFVSQALGLETTSHAQLFELAKSGKKLSSDDDIADFFVGLGVKKETANQTIKSFAVNSKLMGADNLAAQYGIQSVPSFIVNDKYLIDPSMTDSDHTISDMLKALSKEH
eukprot:gene5900-6829_t